MMKVFEPLPSNIEHLAKIVVNFNVPLIKNGIERLIL